MTGAAVFYDSGNFIREEPGKMLVMMEAEGPGCIDRIWMARKQSTEKYDILFYLDDPETPVIAMDLDELWSMNKPPFVRPFIDTADRALFCYVPIAFEKSCKVVLHPTGPDSTYSFRENSAGDMIHHVYYQLTWRRFEPGTAVRPFSWELNREEMKDLVKSAALWNRAGKCFYKDQTGLHVDTAEVTLASTETLDLFSLAGPATIQSLKLQVSDPALARDLWLGMTWDDRAVPAVDVPLTALFAAQDLAKDSRSLMTGIADGWYYCCYPCLFSVMPGLPSPRNGIQRSVSLPVSHMSGEHHRTKASSMPRVFTRMIRL